VTPDSTGLTNIVRALEGLVGLVRRREPPVTKTYVSHAAEVPFFLSLDKRLRLVRPLGVTSRSCVFECELKQGTIVKGTHALKFSCNDVSGETRIAHEREQLKMVKTYRISAKK